MPRHRSSVDVDIFSISSALKSDSRLSGSLQEFCSVSVFVLCAKSGLKFLQKMNFTRQSNK